MPKGIRECPIADYLDSAEGKYSEAHADTLTREALSGIIPSPPWSHRSHLPRLLTRLIQTAHYFIFISRAASALRHK